LRTACAVAQGLAFAAGVPVPPVNSLLALAEDARCKHLADAPSVHLTALLDARMDEIYTATFAFQGGRWRSLQDAALVRPDQLDALATVDGAHTVLAGNVFADDGAPLAPLGRGWSAPRGVLRVPATPNALALLRLAPRAAGRWRSGGRPRRGTHLDPRQSRPNHRRARRRQGCAGGGGFCAGCGAGWGRCSERAPASWG